MSEEGVVQSLFNSWLKWPLVYTSQHSTQQCGYRVVTDCKCWNEVGADNKPRRVCEKHWKRIKYCPGRGEEVVAKVDTHGETEPNEDFGQLLPSNPDNNSLRDDDGNVVPSDVGSAIQEFMQLTDILKQEYAVSAMQQQQQQQEQSERQKSDNGILERFFGKKKQQEEYRNQGAGFKAFSRSFVDI
eukprot:TRINITY_DN2290_c0_g1_i1.p3 TRINITY_DN2290_c0_g1~~TRINITY_DN2290_c0_g1_i1.p3  ORF type:complete len:186 (+),score=30.36 TRINITY_DN2290_c0_g1_i1:885-1442(+)